MSKEIFNSKEALLAVEEILTIAEKVAVGKISSITEIENEKIREIIQNGIKYKETHFDKIGGVVGATAGGGLGVASGFGLISLMAAEGAAGAAAVTSGLASIGAVFGGGMLAGIGALLVIPVALATVGGIIGLILSSRTRADRNKIKKGLLLKANEVLSKLKAKASESDSSFIIGTLLTVHAIINDLNRDLIK